ncbi:methyl-accepting chemotaxis protein [Paracraurococcus ruber]|uniref:Methyl-accepting chemotaxis protein n=1 Tax=Paracraurococcus ruber TaxID=77675 RepID=A0ABS1CXF9_9PROT|nr:methyl-accepting chemotaxis protein [Paracraurococcus ruber]MBK1659110.1 hypothetical protein [Paracraurococcus ruber]TDG29149.1 hypothetical protein E2C05_18630 [Paracraurococcus ruber]
MGRLALWLRDLRIAAKVMIALALMAASGLGASWYAASRMSAVDAHYRTLLASDAAAALMLVRANVALVDSGRLLNLMIATPEPDRMQAVQQEMAAARSLTRERLEIARAAMPALGADINAVEADFQRAIDIAAGIEQATLADDNVTAMRILREQYFPLASASRFRLRDMSVATEEAMLRRGEALTAETAATRLQAMLAAGLGAALSTAIALALMQFGVSRPVGRLCERMLALSRGDKSSAIPGMGRRDEVGTIAGAVELFRQAALEKDRIEAGAATERSARDRRQAAMDRHTQDFGASVSGVMTTLGDAAESMRQASAEMAQVAGRTGERCAGTADGAAQSARDLGTVASAVEQLSASVAEISRQVAQAAASVQDAVGRARATDATVRSLSEAAGQIGEVVRLISDIAGQTNLLALNATIEAARAGEAGKGFAVVASEVKALAGQTAKATEQIASQVAAIQAATTQAVGAVQEVSLAIGQVDEVASAIAAAVEEQGAATREIAASVQTVAHQNEATTRSMQEVSGEAESAGEASREVLTAADKVSRVAGELREEVDQFLAAMRSDDGERRRFERIPAGEARAVLRPRGGGSDTAAEMLDISRGGLALRCGLVLAAGTEMEMDLPGAGGPVAARVARAANGILALAFRQDPATLQRVDRVMDGLTARARAA